MRTARRDSALFFAGLCFLPCAAAGVESQARGAVESLPAIITEVVACGSWTERGQRGHYRIVLAEVSGGAGTEVYVQRIVEPLEGANRVLRVASTTPVRELNDDHSQYQVSEAKCTGGRIVEMRATYEHDEGDTVRRVRLIPTQAGGYRISNVVVRTTNQRR